MAEVVDRAYVELLPTFDRFRPELNRGLNSALAPAASQADRAGRTTGRRFGSSFSSAIRPLAGVVAGAFAVDKVVSFIRGAITAASDLAESTSKATVVFGQSAGAVFELGRTSAKALGQSRQGAIEAAASFGNLFVALKLPQRQAANMSIEMVKLASNLASFNNVSPEDALLALRSGLVGETEPLRRFGVNMNDATIRAQALKLGLISSVKDALTPAAKAQAAYALILDQTKTAQGDFARTSGGLANQQRIVAAQFKDASAQLGTRLQPIAIAFFSFLSTTAIPALTSTAGFVERNATAFKVLAVALGAGLAVYGLVRVGMLAASAASAVHTAAISVNTAATRLNRSTAVTWLGVKALEAGAWLRSTVAAVAHTVVLNAVTVAQRLAAISSRALGIAMTFALGPVGLIIIAVAALAAGLIYAYRHSETFRNIVNGAFRAVGAAGKFMWENVLRPVLRALVAAFFNTAGAIVNGAARAFGWVPKVGDKLKGAAREFNRFRDNVNRSLSGVRNKTVGVNWTIRGVGAQAAAYTKSGGKIFAADGGIVRFARGTERHVAQVARPGAMRVWAEPETGGEAYIPLASSKRGRSTQILSAVASRFGMGLLPMAAGGLLVRPGIRGMDAFAGAMASFDRGLTRVAAGIGKTVARSVERGLAGGLTSPGAANALRWARTQAGKPYLWGGVGPAGYDCSGFMSAIINVIKGRNPYRRLFATGSMPAGGLVSGLNSAFSVGWFTGSPGHTAGTLNGVNVESRGGRGVVVGRGARGANNPLFNRRAGLRMASGGIVDAPYDLFDPAGRSYIGTDLRRLLRSTGVTSYDNGGLWPSGTLGLNTSGSTETVVPGGGIRLHPDDLRALVSALETRPVVLQLDGRELDRWMGRQSSFYERGG